jgi:hypothetical protein
MPCYQYLSPIFKLYARRHDTQYDDIQHNDTQNRVLLCWVSQEAFYEYQYAECRGAVYDTHQLWRYNFYQQIICKNSYEHNNCN